MFDLSNWRCCLPIVLVHDGVVVADDAHLILAVRLVVVPPPASGAGALDEAGTEILQSLRLGWSGTTGVLPGAEP